MVNRWMRRVRQQHESLLVAVPPAIVALLGISAGDHVWWSIGQVAGAGVVYAVREIVHESDRDHRSAVGGDCGGRL